MVWEYQLTTIVMLTRCVEDGKVSDEQSAYTRMVVNINYSFVLLYVYRKNVLSTGLIKYTLH